jgi:hypothetical protein
MLICMVRRRRRESAALVVGLGAGSLFFACSASSPLPPGGALPGDITGPVDAATPDEGTDSPVSSDAFDEASEAVEAGEDVLEGSTE